MKDAFGTAIEGAQVTTNPATSTATTDAAGAFTLANAPIGVYTVTASASGFNAASMSNIGVAVGATTTLSFKLSVAGGALTTLSGKVLNTAGTALAGATVTVSGTSLSGTTDANGSYTIASVPAPGPYFLDVAPPSGYLEGDTRRSLFLSRLANTAPDIKLSARPPDNAAYVGRLTCSVCHQGIAAAHLRSAHWRSLTQDRSRMIHLNLWPAVGGIVNPNVTGQDPTNPSAMVPVYLCQNAPMAYAMKFGPEGGTPSCTDGLGTLVPVSGTYGGEGDSGVGIPNADGGMDVLPNVGVYKQRFLAKVTDVPSALGWTYTGKEKDYLILPVQITQSGDGWPKLAGYHGNDWLIQGRTFSRACSGCHNTGLSISWTNDANAYITSYNYIDFNISCEKCHGPGGTHASQGGGNAVAIVNPKYLSARLERQTCGQCHAADAGKSMDPANKFAYAYNAANASLVGGGTYVPGVFEIASYIGNLTTGGFDAWPDGKHGKAHRQQYPELTASIHANNPYERLTCSNCHSVHSLFGGPRTYETAYGADQWALTSPQHKNNVVCLGCHAGYGPFAGFTKDDVAAVHVGAGGAAMKNGTALSFTSQQIADAKAKIGDAVVQHMDHTANMGLFVQYDPENEPGVGRCATCHMPQTGKSGGYTTGLDELGKTALVEGDESSHRFDIIAPQVSRAMLTSVPGTSDTKIMPNSCGKCHARYRFSAD